MIKKTSLLLCLTAMGGGFLFPGCLRDEVTESYKIYTPVYALKTNVLASINGDPAKSITRPGQIYTNGPSIYLNDVNKGVHIIDNSDPAHPKQTAFLNIPGNENIAIRGNILYADMYNDLLAIDISNPHQAKVTGSLGNLFSARSSYNGQDSNYVLTGWIVKDTSFATAAPGTARLFRIPGTMYYTSDPALVSFAASAAAAATGTAGSTAIMTLRGDYLYAIAERYSLKVVKVMDSSKPSLISSNDVGSDLETIFPIQNKLLLGTRQGVYVYSIDNATQPVRLGEFRHGTACDPVIADQDHAYVTLHTGTSCGGSLNELDVLTAQNISQASLLKTYPMTSPSGLGKDGSLLFV